MKISVEKKAQRKFTVKDFQKFQEDFPSEEACISFLFDQRFKKQCLGCKKGRLYQVAGRKCYACSVCGKHVYPLSGTIFEKSSTPLTLWLYAIFLTTQSYGKLTAKDLERNLGVTYKTAWRMRKKINDVIKKRYKKPPTNFWKVLKLANTP